MRALSPTPKHVGFSTRLVQYTHKGRILIIENLKTRYYYSNFPRSIIKIDCQVIRIPFQGGGNGCHVSQGTTVS